MGLSIQQLTDDDTFSHVLRFEVLEQVCPPELVSELLSPLPCLGRARAQPQPTSGCLLRHRALLVSSAEPGRSFEAPGMWAALALVQSLPAPADRCGVGLSPPSIGDTRDAPSVPARLPSNGHGADHRGFSLWPAADGHRWHTR